MKLSYPACFYPDETKKGAFAVVVPDLPGCVSGGNTLAEAILMGTDAASGWVLDELEDGKPAPPASAPESVVPDRGGFVGMLVLDLDAHEGKPRSGWAGRKEDTMSGNLAYYEEWREELINGNIVAMAPATAAHTYVADGILSIFRHYLRGKKCIPFGDGLLVHLSDKDKFVPDAMIVCDRDKIKPNGVYGAPDLVVEVLSTSTAKNDRGVKMAAYESSGVPEYWIVDPSGKSIEVYLLEDGCYSLANIYYLRSEEEKKYMSEKERAALVTEFKCHLYDDLVIRLDDIFGDLF